MLALRLEIELPVIGAPEDPERQRLGDRLLLSRTFALGQRLRLGLCTLRLTCGLPLCGLNLRELLIR